MDQWLFELLRFTHIMAGVFWTGSIVLLAFFLEPVVRAAGPEGGRFMQALMSGRRLAMYLTIAAWLTVLAGIPVYWRISAHLNENWITSDPGLAYTFGVVVAIAEAFLGTFVNARLSMQVGSLGAQMQAAGGPPPADLVARMGALQARLRTAARLGAAMLIAATAAMAMARYL